MLQGLAALAADPATRVIVLISKPPSAAIAERIEAAAAAAGKLKPESSTSSARRRSGCAPACSLPRRCATPPTSPSRWHRGEAVPASVTAPTALALAAASAARVVRA